jgi:hypothetical protein
MIIGLRDGKSGRSRTSYRPEGEADNPTLADGTMPPDPGRDPVIEWILRQ